MMDHEAFRESEVDALYGELDEAGQAAMAEHAATCASCRERFERLQGTRSVLQSVALETVSSDLESRIMAAVDAGVARRSAAPPLHALAPPIAVQGPPPLAGASANPVRPMHALPPGTGPAPRAEGATIFAFLSRPAFAVAATFILAIGGAVFLMSRSAQKSAPAAAADSEPTASALAAAPAERDEPTPAATTVPATPPVAAASALAMNDPESAGAMAAAAGPVPPSVHSRSAKKPGATDDGARAFAAATALYNAGRYAEALPRFEALKGTNPDADLYAARCVARINGCAAAAPRYDAIAQANAGSDTGNRATLEGARCYEANGQLLEARKRFTAAKDERGVSAEAQQELDALDGKPSAGTPAAGAHAAPRAMPAPAPPPAATAPAKK